MMSGWSASALLLSGLGIAPLVLSASQALRWERDSLARGQAVLLAQDLSHRLHLNAVAASRYQLAWGEQPATLTCRDAPCSRDNWARADLSQWRTQVGQVLPQGDAWLQGANTALPARWLVLAWSSDASADASPIIPLPVPCPEGKRCLIWVLNP
jgi:Tfp pilus assembly protein PilV